MRRNRHPTEADNIMMGGEIYLFSKYGYSIADNIFLVHRFCYNEDDGEGGEPQSAKVKEFIGFEENVRLQVWAET